MLTSHVLGKAGSASVQCPTLVPPKRGTNNVPLILRRTWYNIYSMIGLGFAYELAKNSRHSETRATINE